MKAYVAVKLRQRPTGGKQGDCWRQLNGANSGAPALAVLWPKL